MLVVGNRLIKVRVSLGYSVDEFAKILKIHRSSMYRYEGLNKEEQRELPLEKALMICENYDISFDWLAGLSDIMYRSQNPNKLTKIYESLSDNGQKELFNFAVYLRNKECENKNE